MEEPSKTVKKKKIKEAKQAKEQPQPVLQETAEIPEKKETPEAIEETAGKKTENSSVQPKKTLILGVPNYLLALAILLVIVGGIALGIYLQPKTPIIEPTGGNGDENKAMEIELIYSDDCSFCAKHNTIFDSFKEKKIPFTVKETEASTNIGVQKIAAFQINILPAALVPESGLKNFPETLAAMKQSFKKTGGYFVVPESNLDSSKIYSRMYLKPVDPTDCNASDAKSSIILFDDPYNEISIKMEPILSSELAKFAGYTTTTFEYIPANSSTLKKDADMSLAKKTNEYLYCAGIQNKFIEGFSRALSIYCGGKNLQLTQQNIAACPISPHFGTPLSLKEIEAATIELKGIEPKPFDACINISEQILNSSVFRAKNYGLTRTSTAIVDCRYNVPYTAISLAVCASKPGIKACKTNDQNSSS